MSDAVVVLDDFWRKLSPWEERASGAREVFIWDSSFGRKNHVKILRNDSQD